MQFPKGIPQELIENRRKQFERALPEHLNLERDEVGEYIHKYVRSLWQGFNLNLMTDNRATRRANQFKLVGRAEPKYPHPVPQRPYKHWVYADAVEEANHLASVYPGNTFVIYEPIYFVKKNRSFREAHFGGLKRIYTPAPSLYYMYRGYESDGPSHANLFLTNDYGTAVNPSHVAQFEYNALYNDQGVPGVLHGHQGTFGLKISDAQIDGRIIQQRNNKE